MPAYVRVKDGDTGHEVSIPESALPHGNYTVLDEPAVDVGGEPLPPKFGNPKSLSSKSTGGQQAETKKEKADG